MINTYQCSAEQIKDQILEDNRKLVKQLAEVQQKFDLLRLVHFDKTINLDVLNDIIVGCTGCLYSVMFYMGKMITNVDPDSRLYQVISENQVALSGKTELFVSSEFDPEYTFITCPVSVTHMVEEEKVIKNVLMIYPSRFMTLEVLSFVRSFMMINDVLINIVLDREEMSRRLETEPLTNLLNRRSWTLSVERIMNEKTPFFILFMDIDGFKTVNDTYGHQTGDEILITTAKWLKKSFREEDKVFRLGGDEFAIAGKINAGYLEGFMKKIHSLNAEYISEIRNSHKITGSVSIGCLLSDNYSDQEILYSKVDHLLYQSKKSGKNTINMIVDFNNTDEKSFAG